MSDESLVVGTLRHRVAFMSRAIAGAMVCSALLLQIDHNTHAAGELNLVGVPATATAPAVRIRQSGPIPLPINPLPRCEVLDSFGDPRSGGRSHEGVDILATQGQPVIAVANGTLVTQYRVDGPDSSLSGNAWRLAGMDGNVYFYAHMSGFAQDLAVGTHVSKGQVIGYVGDTGNPGPGNFHLHFEYQPNGGPPVNSLALLEIPWPCRIY